MVLRKNMACDGRQAAKPSDSASLVTSPLRGAVFSRAKSAQQGSSRSGELAEPARPERLYPLAFITNAFPPVKNLTSSSSCTSFYRFAIFARFANDSCGFLQRKVPYRGTIFHIRKPALHQRSALRNFDFAYTAPRYKQLPQWPKPPPHGTLRMTKFVCSVPRLYPARARHPQAAGPACKEENYGKKCDRRPVRRPDIRHQRQSRGRV